MSEDCLFCRIADRRIPTDVVYESTRVLGFRDAHPQAPVHVLLIPKKHLSGVHEITPENRWLDELVMAAHEVAEKFKIAQSGYRLVVNCRRAGGQTVDHLHVHLLGGRQMSWPPG